MVAHFPDFEAPAPSMPPRAKRPQTLEGLSRPPSSSVYHGDPTNLPVVLKPSASESQLGLARRARPRHAPAARWIRPLSNPVQPFGVPDPLNDYGTAFARFVSESLFLDASEVLELVVRTAPELIPNVQRAHFLKLGMGASEQRLALTCSGGSANPPPPLSFPAAEGLCGHVARSGLPAIEADASLHLSYSQEHESTLLGRSPVLCLPVGSGRPGVRRLQCEPDGYVTGDDARYVQRLRRDALLGGFPGSLDGYFYT